MTKKPPQNVIRINIIETDPQEVSIAKYLRNTGKIKSQLMESSSAYWYSIALAEDPDRSDEEVEIALSKSLSMLSAQMNHLLEYHRIKRKIHLPPESLMRLGLMATSQSVMQSQDRLPPETGVAMSSIADRSSTSNRTSRSKELRVEAPTLQMAIIDSSDSDSDAEALEESMEEGSIPMTLGGIKISPEFWNQLTQMRES
jgi:hypothetical protein